MNKNIGIVVLIIAVVAGVIGYTKLNSSAGAGASVEQVGDTAVIKL